MLKFVLAMAAPPFGETGPVKMLHPQRSLKADRFPEALVGKPVKVQVNTRYNKVDWVVEMLVSECLFY